jgi:alcohol dehydrogenase
MDVGKGIAAVAANGGSIADYYGLNKFAKVPYPMIAVPTTAGTGAEVSSSITVRDPSTHTKRAARSLLAIPRVAVLDPELLATLPEKPAAEAGMDALTHLIEAYVSKAATPITDMMSLHGIRLVGCHLAAFVANRANMQAATNMHFASLLGGIVISHARTGAAHTVTRPLADKASHGLACAVVLPAVMDYNLIADVPKFVDIADALGERVTGVNLDSAQLAVAAVRKLSQRLGIPPSLSDLGVAESELPDLAKTAAALELQHLNPRELNPQTIERILRSALYPSTGC